MKSLHLLGFPGWSCTQTLESWFAQPMTMFDHFKQLELLSTSKADLKALLPSKEPWGLVTWSMGTKMGLKLAECWEEHPPAFWLALSPFMKFVGEGAANDYAEVQQLKAGLMQKPELTLKLFSRGHGVKQAWMNTEVTPEKVELLADSLEILCEPSAPLSKPLEIDCYAIYGSRDKLVNKSMVDEFVESTGAMKVPVLEGLSHALFYEQPEALGTVLESELGWKV